ncbi:MAG: hypothetical protein KA952_08050 [Sediminibacterium sp.]|nr:hypothetical protein [Sediminibacterium sp.]
MIFVLGFLTTSSAYAKEENLLQIGTVKIAQEENKIEVQHGNKTHVYDKSDSFMWSNFIVTTPSLKYAGVDGIVTAEESLGIRPIPWQRDLKHADLLLFPFFSEEKSTIGFLESTVGYTGRSVQTLLFLDTKSLQYVEIRSTNMAAISWKSLDSFPLCPVLPLQRETEEEMAYPKSYDIESNVKDFCHQKEN